MRASATSSATTGRTSSLSWPRRASCTSARLSGGSSDAGGYVTPRPTPLAPDSPQPWGKAGARLCSPPPVVPGLWGRQSPPTCEGQVPHAPPQRGPAVPGPEGPPHTLLPPLHRLHGAPCPAGDEDVYSTCAGEMVPGWEPVGGLTKRCGARIRLRQHCLLLPGAARGSPQQWEGARAGIAVGVPCPPPARGPCLHPAPGTASPRCPALLSPGPAPSRHKELVSG